MDTKSGIMEYKSEAHWLGVDDRATLGSPASLNITMWVYVSCYKARQSIQNTEVKIHKWFPVFSL